MRRSINEPTLIADVDDDVGSQPEHSRRPRSITAWVHWRQSGLCAWIHLRQTTVVVYAVLAITSRVAYFIVTPVWLDYFKDNSSPTVNNLSVICNDSTTRGYPGEEMIGVGVTVDCDTVLTSSLKPETSVEPGTRHMNQVSVYFVMLGQWMFSLLVLGLILAAIRLISPRRLRAEVEYSYPKTEFALIGVSQAFSSLLCNYSLSGTRTAPYLVAVLSNFNIPVQFTVRFLLLRRRTGCTKLLCATVVTMCELICLIPTIFPSLESATASRQDGGAHGVGRFLWPLCFLCSLIPFAVANTLTERSVQKTPLSAGLQEDRTESINQIDAGAGLAGWRGMRRNGATGTPRRHSGGRPRAAQLNLVYFLFWWNFFVVLTLLLFCWTDLIPGFGTSKSADQLTETMLFNLACLFGLQGCNPAMALLGWIDFSTVLIGSVSFAGLMRHSEGANFTIIIMALRTPLVLLFWTLFVEHPFHWEPHLHLSTWLSLGAVIVMFPAIIIYNRESLPRSSNKDFSGTDGPLVVPADDPSIGQTNN